ncbi:MAG TPA: peptidase, partial [Planctomycetaceae bacterium]|nr:peptidase [Planctomycetaceae bacterium]
GGHGGHSSSAGKPAGPAPDLTHINHMVATVQALQLDAPVIVAAPGGRTKKWTGKSDTANRPRRVTVDLDPTSGQITGRQNFADRHWIDRAVAYGIAAHEGQLFGWANVALGLLTGTGLILLSVSGVVMWWKRRDAGVLGAPKVLAQPQLSAGLLGIILLLGLCFPLFAASLCIVLLLEWLVLRRIPSISHWLGLQLPATPAGAR